MIVIIELIVLIFIKVQAQDLASTFSSASPLSNPFPHPSKLDNFGGTFHHCIQKLVELRCHGFQEVHDLKGVTLHDLCSIETFTHCLKHHYSLTDLRFIHGRWCMQKRRKNTAQSKSRLFERLLRMVYKAALRCRSYVRSI